MWLGSVSSIITSLNLDVVVQYSYHLSSFPVNPTSILMLDIVKLELQIYGWRGIFFPACLKHQSSMLLKLLIILRNSISKPHFNWWKFKQKAHFTVHFTTTILHITAIIKHSPRWSEFYCTLSLIYRISSSRIIRCMQVTTRLAWWFTFNFKLSMLSSEI